MPSRRLSIALSLLVAFASVAAAMAQPPPPPAAPTSLAPAVVTTPMAAAVARAQAAATAAAARSAAFEERLPAPLRREGLLDLRLWQWLALPIVLLIALVLAAVPTLLVRRLLRPAVARSDTMADDDHLRRARGPVLLGFTVLFFAASLPVLALPEPVHAFLRGLLKGLGVIALSWAVLRLIDLFSHRIVQRFERDGRLRLVALVPIGRRAAKAFLWVIAVVVLLQNVGLDVTGLLAGLGVGGIAVALAAQKTIENVFGGISVIADQPVAVGDLCRFRADGTIGVIEEIGMRSTRIRTLERTVITIPNADFAQRELENLAARDRTRIYSVLGLRYETTPDQLRSVLAGLRRHFGSHPLVSPEALRINFIGFGETSLDVEISAYVKTTDPDQFAAVREELFLNVIDTVAECGTSLARTVNLATVSTTSATAPTAAAEDPGAS